MKCEECREQVESTMEVKLKDEECWIEVCIGCLESLKHNGSII